MAAMKKTEDEIMFKLEKKNLKKALPKTDAMSF